MSDDLATLAAALKRDHAVHQIELTPEVIAQQAHAHGFSAQQLRRAIDVAVLDQGDGGGAPLPRQADR